MNNKKRNQLIGLIVLMLVALIFLPYLLTNKPELVSSSVPLLPVTNNDVNQIDTMIDDNNLVFTDNPPIENQSALIDLPKDPNLSTQEQPSTVPVAADKANVSDNKNYIVQLVALKNRQKIDELTALLRLNNYNVYTIPKTPKDGQIIRLLVGRYPTKEQAELVVIDLENLTKLKGFVTNKPN